MMRHRAQPALLKPFLSDRLLDQMALGPGGEIIIVYTHDHLRQDHNRHSFISQSSDLRLEVRSNSFGHFYRPRQTNIR